jgi:hypothetical protein
MAFVLSPVLTFIARSISSIPADQIISTCGTFYTQEELIDAKNALWESGPKEILGDNIKRKESVKGTVIDKVLSDIICGIQ